MLTRGPRRSSGPASPHTLCFPVTLLARGRGDRFDSRITFPRRRGRCWPPAAANIFPSRGAKGHSSMLLGDFPKRHAFELCKWPREHVPPRGVFRKPGFLYRTGYNTKGPIQYSTVGVAYSPWLIVAREVSHDRIVLPCSELTSSELVNHARACGRSRTSLALTFCA
jgi:hypothetical protein